jgi:hypothetical protein
MIHLQYLQGVRCGLISRSSVCVFVFVSFSLSSNASFLFPDFGRVNLCLVANFISSLQSTRWAAHVSSLGPGSARAETSELRQPGRLHLPSGAAVRPSLRLISTGHTAAGLDVFRCLCVAPRADAIVGWPSFVFLQAR